MKVTLFRATSHPVARPGAHFCVQEESARAFLEEGDRTLRLDLDVDEESVLDARSGLRTLAETVAGLTGGRSWEVEEAWWKHRWKSVVCVLDGDPDTVAVLAGRYLWIRFEEDWPREWRRGATWGRSRSPWSGDGASVPPRCTGPLRAMNLHACPFTPG